MSEILACPDLDVSSDVYLSREWFTRAMQYGGAIPDDVAVMSIESSVLAGGFMADTYRIKLFYNQSDNNFPQSVVAKFPSSNPSSRSAGREMQAYSREVNFYKHLAPSLTIRVPECYFSEIEEGTSNFALIIEDLTPVEMIDGLPCSYQRATNTMIQLANLHADTWNKVELKEYSWMLDYSNKQYFQQVERWVGQGWNIIKNTAEELIRENSPLVIGIPSYFQSIGDDFVGGIHSLPEKVAERICLVHCDYRLANILYKPDDESITVDWQTFHLGRPGFDTYYFINGTYSDEEKEEREYQLLKIYHERLLQNGVKGYSWEQCVQEHEFGVFYTLLMTLLTAQAVGANGLPEAMKERMFKSGPKNWIYAKEHNVIDKL